MPPDRAALISYSGMLSDVFSALISPSLFVGSNDESVTSSVEPG